MKYAGVGLAALAFTSFEIFSPANGQFSKVDPFNYGPYTAVCAGKTKAPPQARADACTAFMRSKEYYFNAWPYVGRAIAEKDLGNFNGALSDTENAITASAGENHGDPGRLQAYALQAWLLVKINGSLDRALDDCNKVLDRTPANMDVIDMRAFIHFRMGDYAAAIADFNTVEKAGLLSPASLDARGLAKIKNGDVDGGKADRAAAVQKAAVGGNHNYTKYEVGIGDVGQ